MRGRRYSLLFVIYVVVGVFIALNRHWVTQDLFLKFVKAILLVLLWPLALLGVLHFNL
jgi:hypothetical protein